MQQNHDKRFDIALDYGQMFEKGLIEVLRGARKLEVKTERGQWWETGNIALEISYLGHPSGFASTEADWWVHVLARDCKAVAMLWLKVPETRERLMLLKLKGWAREVPAGDDHATRCLLVRLRDIHLLLPTKSF
jgi:hypothetical protein